MRSWLARMLTPDFCGEKLRLVMSHKAMDTYDPETQTIIPGAEHKLWQTCGRRAGHEGDHGGAARLDRWRLAFANRLDP